MNKGVACLYPGAIYMTKNFFLKTISKPVCIFKAKKVMPLEGKTNVRINVPDHMINMAVMSIYGKTPLKFKDYIQRLLQNMNLQHIAK